MKKSLYLGLVLFLFLLGAVDANASSGALKKDSIKTCPNGVTYGYHGKDNHWHEAEKSNVKSGYSAIGSPLPGDPCPTNSNSNSNNNSNNNDNNGNSNSFSGNEISKKDNAKSGDNSLTKIIIDNKEYDTKEEIFYSTTKEEIKVVAIPNDEKATYEIKNNQNLKVGINEILIEVTAENESKRTFKITVNREKVLSSDTDIKLVINEKEVEFNNNYAKVFVSSSETKLNIDYTLNDKNATVSMNEIEELKEGDNELKIIVTAENGSKKTYEVIIHKYSKSEETNSLFGGLLILGVFGYGIYIFVKKIKSK